jgi:hypothetical protein
MVNPPSDPYGHARQAAAIAATKARVAAAQEAEQRAMYGRQLQRQRQQAGYEGPQAPLTPSAPYVPRPPKPKYIRRTLRALIFVFIAYAFLYTTVISYERGHIKGYTSLLQWSPGTGHYSSPLPMVIIGLCFALLTVLQVAKIIKVARLRRHYG